MDLAIGAQLANLDALVAAEDPDGRRPMGAMNIAGSREDRILPHTLMVNRSGRRFVNEALNYNDVCEAFGLREGGSARNVPAWLVFDRQGRDRYMSLAGKVPDDGVPDWLTTADSLHGLAGGLGIPADALRETVERFNGFARDGVDRDFGRGESAWDLACRATPRTGRTRASGTVEEPPSTPWRSSPGRLRRRAGCASTGAGASARRCRRRADAGLYAGPATARTARCPTRTRVRVRRSARR